MHNSFSEEDLAFQQEVREFFADNFTGELKDRIRLGNDIRGASIEWQKIALEEKIDKRIKRALENPLGAS